MFYQPQPSGHPPHSHARVRGRFHARVPGILGGANTFSLMLPLPLYFSYFKPRVDRLESELFDEAFLNYCDPEEDGTFPK